MTGTPDSQHSSASIVSRSTLLSIFDGKYAHTRFLLEAPPPMDFPRYRNLQGKWCRILEYQAYFPFYLFLFLINVIISFSFLAFHLKDLSFLSFRAQERPCGTFDLFFWGSSRRLDRPLLHLDLLLKCSILCRPFYIHCTWFFTNRPSAY